MKTDYLLQIIKKGLKIQKSIIMISAVVITRRTHFYTHRLFSSPPPHQSRVSFSLSLL